MSELTFELDADETSVLELKFGQYIKGDKGDTGPRGATGADGSLKPEDVALIDAATNSAQASAQAAAGSAQAAANSASSAASSANQAKTDGQAAAAQAQASANAAKTSETNAAGSATQASASRDAAAASASASAASSTSAGAWQALAQDWAVKMNGLVSGTDYSSKYYAGQSSASAGASAGSASSAASSAAAADASKTAAAGSAAAAAGSAADAANSAASVNPANLVPIDGSRAMTAPLKTPGLALQGSGARITGDMSNASQTNRTLIQTNVANSLTSVGAIPSGTGGGAEFDAFGKLDPSNSAYAGFGCDGTNVNIIAGKVGSGAFGPMVFYASAAERMRVAANGRVQIGTTADTGELLQVNGFVRSASSNIVGAAGVYRGLWYQTGNINRIGLGCTPSPESGGNLGSDFSIDRYSDNGTWLAAALTISRANGYVTIPGQTQHNSQVNLYGSGQLSPSLYFQSGSYAPGIRSNNVLPGFEFVNSAGNAVPLQITDTGQLNALKGFYSAGGATVANGGSAFRSQNQQGYSFADWINAPVALQVDCSDPQSAYYAIKWTRWSDRHFAAIGAIQNANNQSAVTVNIQGSSAGWTWMFAQTQIFRYDNYTCALNPPSDYRLKENVQDLTGSLDRLMASRPVSFDWTTTGKPDVGFIAHELQECEPGAVTGEKDAMKEADALSGGRAGSQVPAYQSVNYLYLVTDLVGAVQTLKSQLDAALARIASLEGAAPR